MDALTAEALAIQAEFDAGLGAEAGALYPFLLTPVGGTAFQAVVWSPSPQSAQFGRAVTQVPDLDPSQLRLLSPAPGQTTPPEGARIPWDGGTLTVRRWLPTDPLSGERIAACAWTLT